MVAAHIHDRSCEAKHDSQNNVFRSNQGLPSHSGSQGNPHPSSDELIVDWDGPEDPANPLNWTNKRKWAVTIIISSFAFIDLVSSSMAAPAAQQIAIEFHITSSVLISMTTSVFVLGYAVGPLVLGPLSEVYGRSRVLQLANLWYLAWNIGCSVAQSKGQLILFRFMAGLGSSAPLAVGGGILGDIWQPEERGKAMAMYSLTPLLGPVLGAVCGAWIADLSTWRWVYWSTSIVDVPILVAGLIFLKESFAPFLLEQKAKRLRCSMNVEKGKVPMIYTKYEIDCSRIWKEIFARAMSRPFALLAMEPIIQLLALYLAFIYGLFYLFLTCMPSIFSDIYHESVAISGLHYFALGIGLVVASQLNARYVDRIYVYLKSRNGNVGEPEFRLPFVFLGAILLPIGLGISGWAAQGHVHWVVTDMGIVLVGGGIVFVYQSLHTYIIDSFTLHAASAFAAVSVLRSLAGFVFPLFAQAMYDKLGYGISNAILGCIAVALGWPGLWVFWTYGKRIRASSRYAHKSQHA
ncbi:hypothetical protein APHAL10511_003897 [Amanita phalloides]|nr:hypothetical protein APHAL10511_003897 [Amanita phalloides]